MTQSAPTPREAADRVALWLDQWRPDRHQTYSLARTDLQVLINHARATTPGDDRGRELAEGDLDLVIEAVDRELRQCSASGRALAAEVAQAALRAHRCALAAPAETEAIRATSPTDDAAASSAATCTNLGAAPAETEAVAQPEGMCQECRGWVPLVLDLHRSDVEDPCGGSEGVPACGARTDPGQVLCTKPIGHDNGAHAPASPPTQGPAETEALDPHRLGEALDYAWTQWIGDVGHVPDAFHLHPRTARCSATFEGSEFARHAAGRYDHLARLAATPPAPEGEAGSGRCQDCGSVVPLVLDYHESGEDEGDCTAVDTSRWEHPHATPAPASPRGEGAGEGAGETAAMTVLRELVEGEKHWTPDRDEAYQAARRRASELVASTPTTVASDGTREQWRVGRRNPHTVYRQHGDEPRGYEHADHDDSLGYFRFPEDARRAVDAVNGAPSRSVSADGDAPRWEHRLDVLLTDGVHGFRCPLCGDECEATLDELVSYDRVKNHLLSHDPTLLAGALVEARSWARHGYEIGQRGAGWSDAGVAPAWLTEGHDPAVLASRGDDASERADAADAAPVEPDDLCTCGHPNYEHALDFAGRCRAYLTPSPATSPAQCACEGFDLAPTANGGA